MTRKQNAIMDRKYNKVVVKEEYDYIDRLARAYDLVFKIRTKGPDRFLHEAKYLANGGR